MARTQARRASWILFCSRALGRDVGLGLGSRTPCRCMQALNCSVALDCAGGTGGFPPDVPDAPDDGDEGVSDGGGGGFPAASSSPDPHPARTRTNASTAA